MRELRSTWRVSIHLIPLSGNARNGRKDRLVEVHAHIGEDYGARRAMEKDNLIKPSVPRPENALIDLTGPLRLRRICRQRFVEG
jgi:hypothetical protein